MNIALHALDPRLCISALKGSECIYSPQHQSSWIPVAMVLNWRLTDKIAIRCLGPGYDKLTHKKPKGLKSQRGLYVYVWIRTYIYIYFDYICITRCGGNSLLSPRGWIVAIPVQLWAGDQQTTREQMLRSWSFQCLGQRSTVRATITMWCPSYKLVYNPMKYMYSIECIDIIYNKF